MKAIRTMVCVFIALAASVSCQSLSKSTGALQPMGSDAPTLKTVGYRLDQQRPSFLEALWSAAGLTRPSDPDPDVTAPLRRLGLKLPEGAKVRFFPETPLLVLRSTAEDLHCFEEKIRWLGYPPASHASKATRKRFPVGTALHDLRLPEDVSPMSSGRPIKADRWRDIPPRDVRDKIPESRACWIEAGTRFTLLFNSKDVLIAVWEDPVGPG